jgi:hypothetical protein
MEAGTRRDHTRFMLRTRRNAHFDGQVRRAMSRRDEHRALAPTGMPVLTRPRDVAEQMARWETEGGALGRAAEHRRRAPT